MVHGFFSWFVKAETWLGSYLLFLKAPESDFDSK